MSKMPDAEITVAGLVWWLYDEFSRGTSIDFIHAAITAREAAIAEAARRGDGWQPIATAPRDGSYLIANADGEVCPTQSRDGFRVISNMPGFADWYGGPAIYWQPLPTARAASPAEVG